MRQPDNVRKHLALASITVAVLIAAFVCYLSISKQTPSNLTRLVARPTPGVQQSQPAVANNPIAKSDPTWPVWGGAIHSASQDGSGFFDRQRARDFAASINASEKKYILELNARSLLPLVDAQADDVFGENADSQTVYLQFKKHLTDEQRTNLKALGINLLSYVSGYAWVARGTPVAFQAARQTGLVRGLARIDPHDKLHPAFTHGKIPDYAKTADGRTRFSVITYEGTALADLQRNLNARAALANATVAPQHASVLGPRFEIVTDAGHALEIAALDSTSFVGLIAPPAASRDANTDRTSNIEDVRDGPPNLNGTGVKVAVREIGRPDPHLDFTDRMTLIDSDGSTFLSDSRHATAVVGQIASSGVNQPTAKGVAPNVSILTYSLTAGAFTTPDIIDAANRGARISNHSYGPSNITTFGDYDPISADWDAAMRANDLVGFFAGNEESGGIPKHIDFFVGAKNTICLTATTSTANAGDDNPATPKSDGIASFSEFGPMQDGRVKPDLAAQGDNVTLDSGTNSTQLNSGTSFSTPAAAGVGALVFQHYNNVVGRYPSAALTKALLCNSATDLGATGPDNVYGFGIINAEAAVKTINLRTSPTVTPFIEDAVNDGLTKTFTINVQNSSELKLTLCWMDVAGNPAAAKALVNDLNLELQSPSGAIFLPYSLDPNAPNNAATNTAANTVDPIEQIIIPNPQSGTWTIRVTGASIPAGSQSYALCCNQVVIPPDLMAVITASPTSGIAPLPVMFTSELSLGSITKFHWDFGDGSITEAPDIISIEHTYSTPGTYTATLILNDSAVATQLIRVNKPGKEAQASKGKLKLSFRGTTTTPDDSFAFVLTNSELIVPSKQAKAALLGYAGKVIAVRIGGSEDNNTPASKVGEVTLDSRGNGKSATMTFKFNLPKGEMKVALKKTALEEIFAASGMTRDPASTGNYKFPVEVETDVLVYRGILNLFYSNKNGKSASGKSIP